MRLEKPILFVCADKNRFQINQIFLEKKPTLSADKPTLSADNGSFSEKPGLSERKTYFIWDKPTLSNCDNGLPYTTSELSRDQNLTAIIVRVNHFVTA